MCRKFFAFLLNYSNLFHLAVHAIPRIKFKVSLLSSPWWIIDVSVPLFFYFFCVRVSAAVPLFSHDEVGCVCLLLNTMCTKNVQRPCHVYKCLRKILSRTCKSSIGQVGLRFHSPRCPLVFSWPTMKSLLHVWFCPNALEMSDQMYRRQYDSGRSE